MLRMNFRDVFGMTSLRTRNNRLFALKTKTGFSFSLNAALKQLISEFVHKFNAQKQAITFILVSGLQTSFCA